MTHTLKRPNYKSSKSFKNLAKEIFFEGAAFAHLDLPLRVIQVECGMFMVRIGISEIINSKLMVSLE